jgi:integrase
MAKQKAESHETEKQMTKLTAFFDALGNKAASTVSGYRTAISQFMKFVYPEMKKEDLEVTVEKYFSENRNYHNDFKKFIQGTLTEKPPLSALQTFNQIFNFFALSDVVFSQKERNLLMNQLPTGGVETQESELNHDDIKNILQHCDTMTKSIVLCCATGGLRIGEALNLRCEDIDLKSIPAVISIRQKARINGKTKKTKTGEQRYSFISSEAVAAVREWVKVRGEYLHAASKRGQNFKTKKAQVSAEDDRLFPVSDQTVNEAFRDAVVKVYGKNEVDPTTGRSTHHLHQLRKFFISQCSLPPLNLDIANFFAGHVTPLTKTYQQLGKKQMSDYYLKAETKLLIETPAEIRETATTTKKEIHALNGMQLTAQSQIISLMLEKDQLREKVKEQEQKIKDLSESAKNTEDLVMLLYENAPHLFKKADINKLPDSIGVKE